MKVFHILEEFSEKNNSIVTVTKILSNYKETKNSKIVFPEDKKKIINNEKTYKTVSIYKNIFKLKSEIYFFLTKEKPDIIHIHGLWRPIHLIFVTYAKLLNIQLIIQPHGMLLDEAIKAKSIFSYYSKLLVLFIYQILLKNSHFVAVTEDEKKSIFKYFKSKKIIVIQNPFISSFTVQKKIKKQIAYFGRFNSHKNIDLIINSFVKANLKDNWKLIIYGIDDDINYKKKILNIISQQNVRKKILIRKPIFGIKRKFKKMSENFLNILMSKSEILSLSVLESLSVGTKSLVNINIKYPKKISKLIFFSKPEENIIAKNLNYLTKNYNQSYEIRKNVKNQFKQIYNTEASKKKYVSFLKKVANYKNKINPINIFNITIANALNSFVVPFLVVFYSLLNPKVSAEIGIVEGTIIFILQIFSSNSRAILLNETEEKNFENFIFFRVFVSIIIFVLFYFLFSNINFIEETFHLNLIVLILILWINEITLVYLEKRKFKLLLKAYIFLLIVFYFIHIYLMFFDKTSLINLYLIFSIIGILPLFYLFHFTSIIKTKYKTSFLYNNIFSFLSTLTNSISVVFWRYSILFFTNKDLAGIIFAIFSVASFPATFFNNILGQSILRQKRLEEVFKKYENFFYIISFTFLSLIFVILKFFENKLVSDFVLNTFYFSFLGTLVMLASLRKRHRDIFKFFNSKDMVFKRDILYSFSIFPLIVILNHINGINAISFAYLISAFLSFILYSLRYDKNY